MTIGRIDEYQWEYAVKILIWLAISPRPLEIREAMDILAVETEANSDEGPFFDEELRMPDPMEIPAMCTSLVSTTKGYVKGVGDDIVEIIELRLSHYTVKEYLLSEELFSQLQRKGLFASEADVHVFAAKTLLAYLSSLQDPFTDDLLSDRPLSRHAAEFWLYHHRHLENTRMSKTLLCSFSDATAIQNRTGTGASYSTPAAHGGELIPNGPSSQVHFTMRASVDAIPW